MQVALLTVAAVWLANQAVGFAVLGYPWTVDTILWGIAIGIAALLATGLAGATLRLGIRNTIGAIGATFVVALSAYQGGLFLVTFSLGGQDAFTPAIVGHVALLSLGWTVALVGIYEILRYTGAMSGSRPPARMAPSGSTAPTTPVNISGATLRMAETHRIDNHVST